MPPSKQIFYQREIARIRLELEKIKPDILHKIANRTHDQDIRSLFPGIWKELCRQLREYEDELLAIHPAAGVPGVEDEYRLMMVDQGIREQKAIEARKRAHRKLAPKNATKTLPTRFEEDVNHHMAQYNFTKKQAAAAIMRWKYGWDVSEIARQMQVSRAMVDKHLAFCDRKGSK